MCVASHRQEKCVQNRVCLKQFRETEDLFSENTQIRTVSAIATRPGEVKVLGYVRKCRLTNVHYSCNVRDHFLVYALLSEIRKIL